MTLNASFPHRISFLFLSLHCNLINVEGSHTLFRLLSCLSSISAFVPIFSSIPISVLQFFLSFFLSPCTLHLFKPPLLLPPSNQDAKIKKEGNKKQRSSTQFNAQDCVSAGSTACMPPFVSIPGQILTSPTSYQRRLTQQVITYRIRIQNGTLKQTLLALLRVGCCGYSIRADHDLCRLLGSRPARHSTSHPCMIASSDRPRFFILTRPACK